MSNPQTIDNSKTLTLDSREVAKMVEKNHAHLLRDIQGYIAIISTNPKLDSLDFFVPSSYIDGKGEERPCYLITRKGCDMVANKMTGEKGVIFTATYINKFHEMEQALVSIHKGEPVSIKKDEQEKLFIQGQRAEAMLLNARTRQAKLLVEIQKNEKLSPTAVELLAINTLEILTGRESNYRPVLAEKLYSATEIAEEFGETTANMVGRIAVKNRLKTDEYGMEVLDHAPGNPNKQVTVFKYNEKAKQEILRILEMKYQAVKKREG